MQYSLTNSQGVVVRDAGEVPVTYLHGAGVLFPKLEKALEQHVVGDIVTVRLLPDDAFGKRNVDLLCEVPLDEFPPGETIDIGGSIVGKSEDGVETGFTVTDIRDTIAYLDGNHPLAGQSLVFEVEVQAIRNASDAEIEASRADTDQGASD
jgi:FKBP-type peptidyl-prolyl cis-trans isomerase SlyD